MYAEAYYTYATSYTSPARRSFTPFIYNYAITKAPRLNLALIKLNMEKKIFRSNLAFMYGTYARLNLSNEPKALRFIYEANIGFKLAKQKNIWLDLGVLPSHIGSETAKGNDNFTLTRSIIAENTPYFETGISLNYQSNNKKLYAAALLLNGWQKIKFTKGNLIPAVGFQIAYTFNDKISANYSNYMGINTVSKKKQGRFFQSAYVKFQEEKWGTIIGFDYGIEKKLIHSKQLNQWLGFSFIVSYKPIRYISFAGRLEYYYDPHQVIVSLDTPQNFMKTSGLSFNVDVYPIKRVCWRNEVKWYQNQSAIFYAPSIGNTKNNISFCSALLFEL
ncbi:MAG: outer membrane beta-barrel protein [Bacteroidota bacterium]